MRVISRKTCNQRVFLIFHHVFNKIEASENDVHFSNCLHRKEALRTGSINILHVRKVKTEIRSIFPSAFDYGSQCLLRQSHFEEFSQ